MRPFLRIVGCIGVLVLAVLLTLIGLFYISANPLSHRRSVRGSFSLAGRVMWSGGASLAAYHRGHGYFPPAPDGHDYYGPLVPDLLSTYPLEVKSHLDDYKGPAIDPWRHEALFAGESEGKVKYLGSRNPDSDKMPGVYFYGYPPRYFRWASGQAAIILINGPDEDVDIDAQVLAAIDVPTTSSLIPTLAPYLYDASNGTLSSGDRFADIRTEWIDRFEP